jgi:tRNA/rRNA methyltransferase
LTAALGVARVPAARTPVRGLARLLRRNPVEAERSLWRAMTGDRRFASLGFKWQVPVGPHIADFVSFPLKCMIDLIPTSEAEPAQKARAARRAWMIEHKYRIIDVQAADVEKDVKAALDALAAQVS